METNETKVCKYCGETKPIDAFRLYKGKTRLSKCIACEKADQKAHKSAPKLSKIENVVVKESVKVMPVIHAPKPKFRISYSIIKGDKIVIVDTTPIPDACKFSFDMSDPILFVPPGVSIQDVVDAERKLNCETE